MSSFTDVDASEDPTRCVEYLDAAARGMQDTKARLADLAGLAECARWLDVGCGVGHDVAAHDGGVGVDPSVTLLSEGRQRWSGLALAAAKGASLPFPDGVFDGCRVERVLQHVPDPRAILDEIHRVLRPGARVAVFEPDWASITFSANDEDVTVEVARRSADRLQQGRIGRNLLPLMDAAGLRELDQQSETVSWTRLEDVRRLYGFDRVVSALAEDPSWSQRSAAWMDDLRRRDAHGRFRCFLTRHFAVGVA